MEDIRQFLPATIELATYSIVVGLFMGIGGVLAATDRRYRVLSKSKAKAHQSAQAEGAAA